MAEKAGKNTMCNVVNTTANILSMQLLCVKDTKVPGAQEGLPGRSRAKNARDRTRLRVCGAGAAVAYVVHHGLIEEHGVLWQGTRRRLWWIIQRPRETQPLEWDKADVHDVVIRWLAPV
jgi:hypothetical protein